MIPVYFLKHEDKPTPSVIVNSEGPSSPVYSQVNTEKTPNTWKPQDIDNIIESNWKSAKKQVMTTPTKEISSEIKGSSLEQEWDQYNKKLQCTPKVKNTQETVDYKTPLHVDKDTKPKSIGEYSKPMEEQATTSQHTEIIPALPTLEIVL